MLRFILADLRRLWPGALVVVALIALAVGLGTAITLQERALRLGSARASEAFDLVVGAPGSEVQLVLSTVFLQPAALPLMPGEVLGTLSQDPRVAWAAPIGFGDFYNGNPVVGTTTALLGGLARGVSEGRIFGAEGEAVVGAAVDLPLGTDFAPVHGMTAPAQHAHSEHEGVRYHVVGRLRPTGTPWDRAILVPIQAVWHVHGLGHEEGHEAGHEEGHEDHADGFDADAPLSEDWSAGVPAGLPAVLVKPASIADAYRLRHDYRARPDTMAVFPAEVLTGLYALMGDMRRILAVVAGAAQGLVAGALVLVTVLHVGQRRRQIAALRAFGAPRPAIFGIVWSELFALFALGIGAGAGLGLWAARLMSGVIAERQGFALPVGFAAEDLAIFAGFVAAAALLPLLPAALAWRQPPVAALRG